MRSFPSPDENARDLTGTELVRALEALGYVVLHQTGSHIRIQTERNGRHSETVPNHSPLRMGTLNTILRNVANHFGMEKEEWVELLFSKK